MPCTSKKLGVTLTDNGCSFPFNTFANLIWAALGMFPQQSYMII